MLEHFILSVKRADTPFYRFVKSAVLNSQRINVPVPRVLFPLLRLVYHLHWLTLGTVRRIFAMFYAEPLFRSFASVGKRLYLEKLPAVSGKVDIRVGDDVTISGALEIAAGRVYPESRLIIGNRVYLAHDVKFYVCQEIVVEDGAWIAQGCSVADNDGHASDFHDRLRGLPPAIKEVEPVRIGKNSWIGRGCRIMRGVTIGEGAVLGAGSVVRTDIPAFGVALGNPARVVKIVQPQPKNELRVQEAAASK